MDGFFGHIHKIYEKAQQNGSLAYKPAMPLHGYDDRLGGSSLTSTNLHDGDILAQLKSSFQQLSGQTPDDPPTWRYN